MAISCQSFLLLLCLHKQDLWSYLGRQSEVDRSFEPLKETELLDLKKSMEEDSDQGFHPGIQGKENVDLNINIYVQNNTPIYLRLVKSLLNCSNGCTSIGNRMKSTTVPDKTTCRNGINIAVLRIGSVLCNCTRVTLAFRNS